MIEPERFSNLPEYAFPRLRSLLDVHKPGGEAVAMTIGEPQHAFPDWVADEITAASAGWGKYPANDGLPALQSAIAGWILRRFGVDVDPARQILALNGTREGLFNAMLALCPEKKKGKPPVVLIPNPFYQVYAVAAQAVGAEIVYVPATAETGFLPDFASLPEDILARTAIAYICTPSNPQGAVASEAYLSKLLSLAETHDFQVFADECYSEIYRKTPPPGTLSVAQAMGCDPERVLIFHSLSKRSNLPGLRSGFVAGGPHSIAAMKQLRAYAGAPLPNPLQAVAVRAWDDEVHVEANRALYAPKYVLADRLFGNTPGYTSPEAGFFLWLRVPDGKTGEATALSLWKRAGLRVLPGAYLARDTDAGNPGDAYIRVAMVAEMEVLDPALTRLAAELDLMRSA
jgi:aspartate/methionine/tyrosine aminotransferase